MFRSELAEVDQEKTPEVTATPVNTPAYPISYNKGGLCGWLSCLDQVSF